MKTPDWDDLRFFLAIAEHGGLGAAARALGVEHTTASRRIDALEAGLGLRLFDRLPKGWAITAAGAELLPAARRVEADMMALLRQATQADAVRGLVRIAAPPALCAWLLAPALARQRARHPGLEIELVADRRTADLGRREADLAVRYLRPAAPALAVRRLCDMDYGLFGAPDYLRDCPPADWEFLGYADGLDGLPQQRWLEEYAAGRPFTLRSNDLGSLLQLAISGAGLAVLPRMLARAAGALAEAPVACPVVRPLWLVLHDDVRKSARVRAAADLVAEAFDPRT
ncbi:MAG TPA: LysR family transcriptional regulator [Telluria sp.]|nr:LysR family transcriptional regulator [Telluria sp.]